MQSRWINVRVLHCVELASVVIAVGYAVAGYVDIVYALVAAAVAAPIAETGAAVMAGEADPGASVATVVAAAGYALPALASVGLAALLVAPVASYTAADLPRIHTTHSTAAAAASRSLLPRLLCLQVYFLMATAGRHTEIPVLRVEVRN
jgi:hypothetical protein